MFVSSDQFNILAEAFNLCQSPHTLQLKQAEEMLKHLSQNTFYCNLLYDFAQSDISNREQKQRSLIELKNWFNKYRNFD